MPFKLAAPLPEFIERAHTVAIRLANSFTARPPSAGCAAAKQTHY
jgi:hypothetical protein